ncbi:MAG: YegP family protein [Mycobacterium sp.]|uniref:YegP family protein n=1 Tax=Mycobacterium sp. TaxID=1785 RepID=UPI003F97C60F
MGRRTYATNLKCLCRQHFHLKAPNGEIIVASQGYASKANAHKGIDAIKKHAPDAKIEDLTG